MSFSLSLPISWVLACCFLGQFIPFVTGQDTVDVHHGLKVRSSDGNFVRRMFHGSFVIDKTLYIDGGEYTTRNGSTYAQVILNQTLVFDLGTSFSTSITAGNQLNPKVIDKGSCPNFNLVRFWYDESKRYVYAYGGEYSDLNPWVGSLTVPSEALWQFVPLSSAEGGNWQSVDISADDNWRDLTRPSSGSAAFGRLGGFNLGGYANSHTSQKTSSLSGAIPVPGLQFFNFTSETITNDSALGFSYLGTAALGGLSYVQTWGHSGIVVAIGGQTSPSLDSFADGEQYIYMSNITIFDPESHIWYHQAASGNIPTQRDRFCVVGAQGGDNSTYEIFLYGGQAGNGVYSQSSQASNARLDDLYILSLPAFEWFQANYTPSDPRIYHTCHSIGRQMLSIGGLNPGIPSDITHTALNNALNDTDPYAQGIKVFDLTELKWSDKWDANTPSYDPPTVIKNRYSNGKRFPPAWSDPDLKDIFDPAPSSTPSPAHVPAIAPKKHSHTAAIVGGVIGGVVVIIIVAIIALLVSKKKNSTQRHELAAAGNMHEMQSGYFPELGTQSGYYPELESPKSPEHELPGSEGKRIHQTLDPPAELAVAK